jgi:hypothetical protein
LCTSHGNTYVWEIVWQPKKADEAMNEIEHADRLCQTAPLAVGAGIAVSCAAVSANLLNISQFWITERAGSSGRRPYV